VSIAPFPFLKKSTNGYNRMGEGGVPLGAADMATPEAYCPPPRNRIDEMRPTPEKRERRSKHTRVATDDSTVSNSSTFSERTQYDVMLFEGQQSRRLACMIPLAPCNRVAFLIRKNLLIKFSAGLPRCKRSQNRPPRAAPERGSRPVIAG
jgi:hypothetical protein